jgi:hypothetical protein
LNFNGAKQIFLKSYHQKHCKRIFQRRLKNRSNRKDFYKEEKRAFFMNQVLDQNRIAQSVLNRTDRVFGDRIGIMGKIFGCWHKELSRPFTNQKSSYRACLNCGAMKRFDTETLKTVGPFYYPPTISLEK